MTSAMPQSAGFPGFEFRLERVYELGPRIGAGAYAEVFRALDRRVGQAVAIKRLTHRKHAEAAQRFLREARILAQLQSAFVVQYRAHGQDHTGSPCLVLEWLPGTTLLELHRDQGLAWPLALEVGRQVAMGLEAIHRLGVVHRDIKPANIMVEHTGLGIATKILDLGVARDASVVLTAAGQLVGTPAYMAPEQISSEQVPTAQSDLYSLGVILYELLARRRPFSGATLPQLVGNVLAGKAPRLESLGLAVPARVCELVHCALALQPSARPPSALDFALELDAVLAQQQAFHRGETSRRGPVLPLWEPQALGVLLLSHKYDPSTQNLDSHAMWLAPEADSLVALRALRTALRAHAQDTALRLELRLTRTRTPAELPAAGAELAPGVYVSDALHALLRDACAWELSGPWFRALPRAAAWGEGEGTERRFFGRTRELLALQEALTACVEEQRGRLVCVTGAPGVGRTALLRACVLQTAQSARDFQAWALRGYVQGDDEPGALLRRLLAVLGVVETFEGEDLERACTEALAAKLARGGVLLVLDDFHWADGRSVEVFLRFLERFRDKAFLVVVAIAELRDPGLMERILALGGQELRLLVLPKRESEKLLGHSLAGLSVAPTLCQSMLEGTLGHTYSVQRWAETLRMRRLAGDTATEPPEDVLLWVEQRLSGLSLVQRKLLVLATLFEPQFRVDSVAYLAGLAPLRVHAELQVLRDLGFVLWVREGRLPIHTEYRLAYSLLRETLQFALSEPLRETLLELARGWLATADETQVEALPLQKEQVQEQGEITL